MATHPDLTARRSPRTRTALAVGIPLAVAAAGVTIFLLINGSLGGGSDTPGPGTSATAQGAGQSSATSPSPTTQATETTGPATGTPSPSATNPPATPAGWKVFRHESGFSIAIPKGWVGRDNPTRNRVEFSGPGTTGFLWVEWTEAENGTTDPVKAWESLEAEILAKNGLPEYQRIAITPISYRGRPAADWEFTFQHEQDGLVRVLDRGFRTTDGRPYALYWRVPADRWEQDLKYFEIFARTFQP
jgi:hypothetical protein